MKPIPNAVMNEIHLTKTQFSFKDKRDTRAYFEYLQNVKSKLPTEIFAHLSATFLGFDFSVFEVENDIFKSYGYSI